MGRKFHFHQASPGFHTLRYRSDVQERADNVVVDADAVNVDGRVGVAGDARVTAVVARTAAFHEGIHQRDSPDAAYAADGGAAAGHARTTLRGLMLVAVSGWMTG